MDAILKSLTNKNVRGQIINIGSGESRIITFIGYDKDNPLSKLGDINFWINSKAYNFVENIHQVWLLTIVDLIIGKREYLPN